LYELVQTEAEAEISEFVFHLISDHILDAKNENCNEATYFVHFVPEKKKFHIFSVGDAFSMLLNFGHQLYFFCVCIPV